MLALAVSTIARFAAEAAPASGWFCEVALAIRDASL